MDTNLVLRDGSSNLTADETLTAVTVGPQVNVLWLHVLVPSTWTPATDTIDVELEFCKAATPTTEAYNMNMEQIVAAGHYSVPFFAHPETPSLQVKLNVTDVGGGGINAGATKVWIDTTNRYTGAYGK